MSKTTTNHSIFVGEPASPVRFSPESSATPSPTTNVFGMIPPAANPPTDAEPTPVFTPWYPTTCSYEYVPWYPAGMELVGTPESTTALSPMDRLVLESRLIAAKQRQLEALQEEVYSTWPQREELIAREEVRRIAFESLSLTAKQRQFYLDRGMDDMASQCYAEMAEVEMVLAGDRFRHLDEELEVIEAKWKAVKKEVKEAEAEVKEIEEALKGSWA